MRKLLVLFLLFFSVTTYAQSPLCSSYPTNFCCEYVASVTINGQTYAGSNGYAASSGGTGPNGYYDYTGGTPVPTINAGQNISISYTAQTNGNYMEYFKLWVDFNGNGVLSDPGEQIYAYNVSWLGTKTITSTFQVPTSVFNGQVYMRFMMVYANVPALCGSYAYGNTFDFKTTITGAQDPFAYTGHVYNSEGVGIPNIPLQLYSKLKSDPTYTFLSNHTTDASGKFSLTSSRDANLYDFQLIFGSLTISSPSTSDAQAFNQKVLTQSFVAKDYYRMDVNGDGSLSITDVYLVFMRILGVGWKPGIPNYRIFTPTQYNTINSSTSNLVNSYPGQSSYTISGLVNKDSTNFYLFRTGYRY
jgi:hypothetical protein